LAQLPPLNINPGTGIYTAPQVVSIYAPTAGFTIRYTTNGTNPTRNVGTIYTGPISVSAGQTIKAHYYTPGVVPGSPIATATYTFVPPPTISSITASDAGDFIVNGSNFGTAATITLWFGSGPIATTSWSNTGQTTSLLTFATIEDRNTGPLTNLPGQNSREMGSFMNICASR
jgi:hypothetical protein